MVTRVACQWSKLQRMCPCFVILVHCRQLQGFIGERLEPPLVVCRRFFSVAWVSCCGRVSTRVPRGHFAPALPWSDRWFSEGRRILGPSSPTVHATTRETRNDMTMMKNSAAITRSGVCYRYNYSTGTCTLLVLYLADEDGRQTDEKSACVHHEPADHRSTGTHK